MASVTALASHLLKLEPEKDAARLAFYHFLKNLCDPGEALTSSVLERFLRRSLAHEHWVEQKLALFGETSACLQHFSHEHQEPLPLPPFASPFDLQVIRAESFRTLERVVETWVSQNTGPTDQVRMIPDREERLIVCRLSSDRRLTVNIFDRQCVIRDGGLEPLCDDHVIHYTSDLAVDPTRSSQIEIAPKTMARFRVDPSGVRGLAVRGYIFQRFLNFDGGDFHRHPALFYPLKRVEQFYVNRATDPMYVELTALLEKAVDLISQGHADGPRFAEAALDRGRLAYEQVFIEDRLLRLLLENLERAMKLEVRTPESLGSTGLLGSFDVEASGGRAAEPNSRGEIGLPLHFEPTSGAPTESLRSSREMAKAELRNPKSSSIAGSPEAHGVGANQIDPKAAGLNLGGIEIVGPDLLEIEARETCETIVPKNLPPHSRAPRAH
ncbi:MAG TPA: hypothetical protein PLZ57_04820 [Pseudobdellovibrionaceae bacterium]|nr:hypothetical protein [Pseudobdellovibrionaceae bacterium]